MAIAPSSYTRFLRDLRPLLNQAQQQTGHSVNQEPTLIALYWRLGRAILGEEGRSCWTNKDIDRLARDLKRDFPGVPGLAPYNVHLMRLFAQEWPDEVFVEQVAARIPWLHHRLIMERVEGQRNREFYVRQTLQQRWTRAQLERQIASGEHERAGHDAAAILAHLSHCPDENTSVFAFEQALLGHTRDCLLQARQGFAFVGIRYAVPWPEAMHSGEEQLARELLLGLLFYHLEARCFVVVQLHRDILDSRCMDAMNAVLQLVDARLRHPNDAPCVGILVGYQIAEDTSQRTTMNQQPTKQTAFEVTVQVQCVARGTQAGFAAVCDNLAQALQREMSRLPMLKDCFVDERQPFV